MQDQTDGGAAAALNGVRVDDILDALERDRDATADRRRSTDDVNRDRRRVREHPHPT